MMRSEKDTQGAGISLHRLEHRPLVPGARTPLHCLDLTFCEDIPRDCVTERLVVYYLLFAKHVQLSPCMVEIMRYAG